MTISGSGGDSEGQANAPYLPTNDTDGATETESTAHTTASRVGQLPEDVIFGLSSNERRRLTLPYLTKAKTTTLSEPAEHIASIENNKPVTSLSSSERKCVYVALYQNHLPKMNDANVIDYDQNRGTLELRPVANQLLIHLDLPSDETDRNESRFRNLLSSFHQKFSKL
jgi:hypothetical protein